MTEEIDKYEVRFKLNSFTCNAKVITKLLNITPHDAWNKGDIVSIQKDGKAKMKKNYSSWQKIFFTSKPEEIGLKINQLLDLMLTKYDQLQLIYKQYKAEAQVAIVGYYYYCNFETFLSQETLAKMNRLKAVLRIDLYSFQSDD